MDDYKGKEIQAFDDELGRWEPARIVETLDDGNYLVSFIGWGQDYNTTVPPHRVRVAVNPFLSEVASASTRGRKRNKQEGAYLSYLRLLKRGDVVKLQRNDQNVEGTVQEVDRFSRSLVVSVCSEDSTIHASSLIVPSKGTKEPSQKKSKSSDKVDKVDKVPAAMQECSVDVDLQASADFYSALAADGRLVCCGDIVSIKGRPGINIGITLMKKVSEGFRAEGNLIGDGEVKVSAPIDRLSPSSEKGTRQEQKSLEAVRRQRFHNTVHMMKTNPAYRAYVRRQQLACRMKREITLALKSKLHRRTFTLGPCQFDIDIDIFQLNFFTKRKCEFSYRLKNLCSLDSLLGEKWDVEVLEGRVSFVTQVVVAIAKDDTLNISVFTSVFWGNMVCNYREVFQRDIAGSHSSF